MYSCFQCGSRYSRRLAFCWSCLGDNTILELPQRPRSQLRGTMARASARDLASSHWTLVESAAYPLRVLKGALALVYGPPGAGKSTMAARWLDGVEGPVVFVAAEEGLGPALSERLSRLAIRRRDFHVLSGGTVDALVEELQQVKARAVCIDSLSVAQLVPGELRKVQESAKVPLVLGTLQVTKSGQAAGSHAWLHEADVVVHVEKMKWTLEKSRYQDVGAKGEVLNVS